jgi:hypothetical protein
MNQERNKDSLVSCLLKQGFSLPEARDYLRSFQLESKALSSTHLFRNGGIKRVENKKEE